MTFVFICIMHSYVTYVLISAIFHHSVGQILSEIGPSLALVVCGGLILRMFREQMSDRIGGYRLESGKSGGIALNYVYDVVQLHLAVRTPPFSILVPKSQAPEAFALHQHHLAHRRQDGACVFDIPCRRRVRHDYISDQQR